MRRTREKAIFSRKKNIKKGLVKFLTVNYLTVFLCGTLVGVIFTLTGINIAKSSDQKILQSKNQIKNGLPGYDIFAIKPKIRENIKNTLAPSLLSLRSTKIRPQKQNIMFPIASAQTKEEDFCLSVPILLYHHIQPLDIAAQLGHEQLTVDSYYFEEQLKYLVEHGYRVISADELVGALINRHILRGKNVMITIDDGYDDNYEYAFRLLKKYNLKGNFMIPTGLIGREGYMTWKQLKEMASSDVSYIYNHTLTHAYLGGETREKIEAEITESEKMFEENLNIETKIFTYPYGSFDDLVINILKEKGFAAAFSTIGGETQCLKEIFSLKRLHIGNSNLNEYGL